MTSPIAAEAANKLDNIINHTRQSTKFRNDSDQFVREVIRRAREARLNASIPTEHIEAMAAEGWLKPLVNSKSRAQYPFDILEIAAQRRNHRLMLKLLRHPEDAVRIAAAEQFQMLFAMMDDYYNEASALILYILQLPTEVPSVKYSLLQDLGRSSRRGMPGGVSDVARRLIFDLDQGVSYHALRLLIYLTDIRDWKTVLERMNSLVGEEDEASQYFLSAGVDYLAPILQYEPSVAEWMKLLIETYPATHMAVAALDKVVRRDPDTAFHVGLIDGRMLKDLKGG